jgi:hypothetical protein
MTSSQYETTGVLLIIAGFLALLGCLGYQGYFFLKYGEWFELSAADALHWVGFIRDSWYFNPQNWIGVHKILSSISAGAACFLLGVGLGMFMVTAGSDRR